MDAYGDILYNGYGSTEVGIGSLGNTTRAAERPRNRGQTGRGMPGAHLRAEAAGPSGRG